MIRTDEGTVAVVSIESSDGVAAILSALDALRSNARVKAIVLRVSSFSGLDPQALRSMKLAIEAEAAADDLAKRLALIGRFAKPVVAWIEEDAMGAAFELALACTACVTNARVGLPAVKLGLVPPGNGLLRVAQRVGIRGAIELGLSGRSVSPREARDAGLVDEIGDLEAARTFAELLASRPIMREMLPRTRARTGRTLAETAIESTPIGRAVLLDRAKKGLEKGHVTGERILEVLGRLSLLGFSSAASLEARIFGELAVSEASHRLVELSEAAKTMHDTPRVSVERIAVVGAGLMGAGIASAAVRAGLEVRLRDKEEVALGRGLRWVKEDIDHHGEDGPLGRAETFARLSGTIDGSGLGRAEIAIEAVVEDLARKQAVLTELEERVSADCVIASTTHAIPIGRIASSAQRPARVVGMHWLGPLVEIVAPSGVDPAALERAVSFARRLEKTVIVVKDGPGFYTSRILAPYLEEAIRLVAEGFAIDVIDRALVDWGFPVGPLATIDTLGLDVVAQVATVLSAAFGARRGPPTAMEALRRDDRAGKKNGRGFYLHGAPDETVYRIVERADPRRAMPEDLSMRCSLAMINEAMWCLGEEIVASATHGDVGAVLGLGFPAFRGGPFRFVDVIGPADVLRRVRSLEQRFGGRFEPAPLLVDMARTGKRFYS